MNQPETIAIVLLIISAAVLGTMVAVFHGTGGEPAVAEASSRSGEYIMAAGGWSERRDLMYVVDIGARRLNAYTINLNTNAIERVDGVDLRRYFGRE